MSTNGGSEEEFQEYWKVNWPASTATVSQEGWVRRLAHPQVKNEVYWYNIASGEIVWEEPLTSSTRQGEQQLGPADGDLEQTLSGTGPVWEMSVADLKRALRDERQRTGGDGSGGGSAGSQDFGWSSAELARRACAEYEQFMPRVLSWHDYQYITFWFFGGMENKSDGGRGGKSFFGGENKIDRDFFAHDGFFAEAAKLLLKRMHLMHPINLTYFLWTYARAGIAAPELMEAAGNHLCEGWLPTLDRCSLGTMVWNFSKLEIRHDRYFELSAAELSRPNRLRSLAPRNFQNTMIAFSRRRHWHEKLFDAMARGIPRLLDNHDPRYPKTDRSVLFSYTCVDGSEVPADAFRIGGLTVIAKAFHEMRVGGEAALRCMASMLNYTVRSVERSPPMMREPGDACGMVRQLGYIGEAGLLRVVPMLEALDHRSICQHAPEKNVAQMRHALRRAGVILPPAPP